MADEVVFAQVGRWCLVENAELEAIRTAAALDTPWATGLRSLLARIDNADYATAEQVEQARERHAIGSDDEIEIDPNAPLSIGTDGYFIQGWLWMGQTEDEQDDEFADSEDGRDGEGARW